jgi:hypothetical protein
VSTSVRACACVNVHQHFHVFVFPYVYVNMNQLSHIFLCSLFLSLSLSLKERNQHACRGIVSQANPIFSNSVALIFDQVAALLAFLCLDQKHYLDDILSARFSCLNDMYLTQVTKGRWWHALASARHLAHSC